ncbi:hypothetical protein JHU38_10000 [Prevotella sp. A2931]|uniref:Lipoprotein-associated type-17 domain-containing protein n=1 Tax=Prevotella illustrans TaxID=2800387 RepID=A0ABS3M7Q0_9BACT|nr:MULTISPECIES: lipoprotein 17-related variable surface protein [Prevotella]MBO1364096.1 hypothetical protein [Prevotella illustrans]PTL27045.1 hypothetical protein C3V39_08440 [Prevotella sp. oral taxon 820]
MKKVLLIVALCAMMSACGKDESGDNEKKPPTPPQTEIREVKDEKLVEYFGLSKSLTVYQALEKIKAASGVKTIGGREISVNSVTEVSRDEQEGSFAVKVAGSVAGKLFEKTATFTGFARKPADELMAKRVVATWKSGVDYQKDFDFDALYRLKDASKFTTNYWAQFIDLTSSTPDGTVHYTFTPEDLAKTTITNVKYTSANSQGGTISFTVTYNGIKGNTGSGVHGAPSLLFDKTLYYQNQVPVNTEAAKTLYMHGVYENLAVFYTELLQYDKDKFVPQIAHKVKDDSNNTISVTLKLLANDGKETELAQFDRTLGGFKPLTDLKSDLLLANSVELGQYFGKKFRSSADGDKLSQMEQYPVKAWIGMAQKSIRRGGNSIELTAEQVKGSNGSSLVTVWKPMSGQGSNLDIYLSNPIFEVTEARKEGNFLYLKLKLRAVNETSLDDVTPALTVHLLQ